MLKSKMTAALLAAGALAGLAAAAQAQTQNSAQNPAQNPAQSQGSLDEHVSCAALFFVLSQGIDDAEVKGLAESAMSISLNRAESLGAARNLDLDALIGRAAAQAEQLQTEVDARPAGSDNTIFLTWGPGLERCLTLVSEDS